MTSRGPRRTPGAVIGDVQEMVVRSNSWRRAQGKGDGSWARGSLVVRLDTGWAGSGVEQEKGRPLASSHTDSIRERYPEKLALSRPRRLSRRAADPVSACARQITALEEAPPPPSAALDAAQRGDVLCYFRVCSVLGAPGVVGRELTTDAVRSAATNTTGTTTTHDSVLVQERRRAGPPSQRLLAGLVVSSRRGSLTQLVSSSTAGVMIKPACCACSVLKQPSRPDCAGIHPPARPCARGGEDGRGVVQSADAESAVPAHAVAVECALAICCSPSTWRKTARRAPVTARQRRLLALPDAMAAYTPTAPQGHHSDPRPARYFHDTNPALRLAAPLVPSIAALRYPSLGAQK
ncbi:hypothetical protein GTA08_BOTSDO03477 [Botryosphaeria dothidea]|uniref:Uncharacterized protein n=1 Tax=Botryosphaeria dothidea TaxID=55169 RepID=A0A8H4IWQ0_9PEZI|nr:hypothetical protein GTA08_BOTSDO03477 [Botryosphaeria dothidea]